MKKVIVLQGPNTHPKEIKNVYSGKDVIFSCSVSSETESLLDSGFNILRNEEPKIAGKYNFNYQVKNTISGIRKAKEIGYDFVLKIRSDITIPRIDELLNLMGEKSDTIFFSAYHNWNGGYLCEHMVYGEINKMEILWDIPESDSMLPPEVQLTRHFFKNLPDTKVDYIFPLLYSNNIKAYWEKRHFFLNEYENDKLFTYDKYK